VTAPARRWRLAADTGGTFTDVVAEDPAGHCHRAKVLSSSALRGRVEQVFDGRCCQIDRRTPGLTPGLTLLTGCDVVTMDGRDLGVVRAFDAAEGRLQLVAEAELQVGQTIEIRSPEPAPVLAARLLTGTPQGAVLPPMELRLATTRGTNALLERRGAPTAFLVTRGFRDLLTIGTQERPELFARRPVRPVPLPSLVVEVHERLAADGTVLEALDEAALLAELPRLRAAGIESVAVALLHAYRNPVHEERVVALLTAHGFPTVVASEALARRIKFLPRAETAVVEAYLAPIVGSFLASVAAALPAAPAGRLFALTSAGGLVAAADFRAKDSLLSGPAGGVVGAQRAARAGGFTAFIGFDMGGTSTDVARASGGGLEYTFEQRVGDARLLAPALAIETVAAGGGSIVAVEHGRLQVGPASAGATPGPACYGAGGPLTLTDVNLLLGRFDPDRFGLPIDVAAAERAADRLVADLAAATGESAPRETVLEGCLALADERMADAIRRISVRRGFDPADHVLVAFGGAGGLHACAVAERLGMSQVLVPADGGLLSAVGLAAARLERFAERTVLLPLAAVADSLPGWLAELAAEALGAVSAVARGDQPVAVERRLAFLRLAGQEATVAVEVAEGADLAAEFARAYEALYGYPPATGRAIELESLRVVAATAAEPVTPAPAVTPVPAPNGRPGTAYFAGAPRPIRRFDRDELPPGVTLAGPALVVDRYAGTLAAPGWRLAVDGACALVLTREAP
jgi:5-oxoprolinase (ATP-hydrolysing)